MYPQLKCFSNNKCKLLLFNYQYKYRVFFFFKPGGNKKNVHDVMHFYEYCTNINIFILTFDHIYCMINLYKKLLYALL